MPSSALDKKFEEVEEGSEFDVLGAFFYFFEFFIECGGRHFGPFQHIDSLRTDSGKQIIQVFGTVHVMRYEVVDLVIREISLLFACIDQLLYIVVLVIKSQEVSSNNSIRSRGACGKVFKRWESGVARDCAPSTNLLMLAHKCWRVYYLPPAKTPADHRYL